MNPYQENDLRSFLLNIPQEEIDENTARQEAINAQEHRRFLKALESGKCFLCGHSMNSFVEQSPCFHWLTYPSGAKKKLLVTFLSKPTSFFRLEIYFRWLANTETPLKNISDFESEVSDASVIEETIKYRQIEWSFSASKQDVEGHTGSAIGAFPHYHLQVSKEGNVIIKFNDCHVPFTDDDLFSLELRRQAPDLFHIGHTFGEGLSALEKIQQAGMVEELDKSLRISDDPKKALINRQTVISAPEGKTISGDKVVEAYEESKITGEPVGRILQRMYPEATTQTVLSPMDDAAELKKRSGRGNKG